MSETAVRGRTRARVGRATLILILLLLIPGSSGSERAGAQEERSPAPDRPRLDASAWALVDMDTGLYLAGNNPDRRLPIAATANIMTALVALDEGFDPEQEVTISSEAESYVGLTYSNIGLIAGERVTLGDLLVAALVPSGTDAVYALAEHFGDGSTERFVEKMNAKAESMGLENTNFTNPAGLDDEAYSSARDLAEITRAAMEHPEFARTVALTEATVRTQSRDIEVFTTNELLYTYDAADGVKTGTSPGAGPCLVASAERGEESYIAVILGARDEQYRFGAGQVALAYGFDAYERRPLIREGDVYEEVALPYRPGESVGLAAARDVVGPAGPGLEAERDVEHGALPLAATEGERLGSVELLVGGESLGRSPLVSARTYTEATLWEKAWYAVKRPLQNAWARFQA